MQSTIAKSGLYQNCFKTGKLFPATRSICCCSTYDISRSQQKLTDIFSRCQHGFDAFSSDPHYSQNTHKNILALSCNCPASSIMRVVLGPLLGEDFTLEFSKVIPREVRLIYIPLMYRLTPFISLRFDWHLVKMYIEGMCQKERLRSARAFALT